VTRSTDELSSRLSKAFDEIPTVGIAAVAVAGDTYSVWIRSRQSATATVLDEHSGFELGSVTKTFTTLLLADMVERGEVSYDDPIDKYLPAYAAPRHPTPAPITLRHLATHTAGLPRLPSRLYLKALARFWSNPYARHTLADLYQATARLRLRHRPGDRVHYSNFGIGLLGQLLANAAGTPYSRLVLDRVCRPLGMHDAATDDDTVVRPVQGYHHGRRVPPWRMGALAAAGTLRCSITDLRRYLLAHLHPESTPLAAALTATHQPQLVTTLTGESPPLGWNRREVADCELFTHSGATRGGTAFVGFCPERGVGVAAVTDAGWTWSDRLIPTAYRLLTELVQMSQTPGS